MTMYRYMVLLWPRKDNTASRTAEFIAANLHEASHHNWRKAWEAPGITVLDSGEHKGRMQTYRLADNGGVALGRLFRNDYSSVNDDLPTTEVVTCLKSKGQHLIDNYWGCYVAFLNDQSTGTRYVLRDPSGAFPCLYTQFQNVEIYFSDMQDAADLDFLSFTINWEYIKGDIELPGAQKIHTGLNEVTEVQPAECIEITAFERKRQFLWDPYEISQTDIIEDPQEAAAILRETVMNATGAIAGCYDSVMLHLGGLDSSILLACLAQAPNRPKINALTHYTDSPLGEERRYSRQVAEKYGVNLAEIELDYRRVDLTRVFSFNKTTNPIIGIVCTQMTNQGLEHAIQKNSQAVITGSGGDNVFYQMPYYYGALDYVRSHGLVGKDGLRVLLEASRYGRKSIFATTREMLRERFAPEPCYEFFEEKMSELQKNPLINPEFLEDRDYREFLHPFMIPNDDDCKGKYAHIRHGAIMPKSYFNRYDVNYHCQSLYPLVSQPVVEACLRMPIWVLTYGGVDRGLARKAFRHDLPEDIIRRHTKSTPQQHYVSVYEHNIDFLKENLLDGVLVEKGVLLRDKLEAAFNRSDPFLFAAPVRMLGYLALEAWVRDWSSRKEKRALQLEAV